MAADATSLTSTPRILIVEDDAPVREAIGELVEDAGALPVLATQGRQALNLLQRTADEELPCLILLDLMLPVMDGWEFRTRQLADARLAPIPVVVTTALDSNYRKENLLRAAGYLTKPFRAEELSNLVRQYCARS